MMQAAWLDEFGGPEVIKIGPRPAPVRHPGEVLVRLAAATVNHRDIYLRRGEAGRIALPVVLGSDGAGEVVAADPSSRFQAGHRVAIDPVLSCGTCRNCAAGAPHKCPSFGMVGGERDGTHAQFVAVPESCLVPVPEKLDLESAAAISLAGLTAWNMVVDEGEARADQHALVLGASGGVGVFVVLLLKRLGVTVHAVTSSAAKRERLLALGADTVLADAAPDVLRQTRQLPDGGVDLAFNCVGGTTWRYVPSAVRSGGRILVCGTVRSPVAELDMRQIFYRNLSITGCSMGTRESLIRVLDVAASDPKFRAPVDETIPLEGLVGAHRRMEAGQLTGKILIRLSEGR